MTTLPEDLLRLLACPECRGCLREEGGTLVCTGCGRSYAISGGIPQLLPLSLATGTPRDPAWRSWAGALDRLVAWRRRTWTGDASAETFQRAVSTIQAEFAAHCRFAEARGSVLDVGCGSADIAAALPETCRYVGVDPLPLPGPGAPPMVRGVAERLPFRSAAFDIVLVLETLDHCQSPVATVGEILRVLGPDGTLCVEQYVSRPRWRERVAGWWQPRRLPGRPAPADSSKVVLLDAPDIEALVRPCFRDVKFGRSSRGSHIFVRAGGKLESRAGI